MFYNDIIHNLYCQGQNIKQSMSQVEQLFFIHVILRVTVTSLKEILPSRSRNVVLHFYKTLPKI